MKNIASLLFCLLLYLHSLGQEKFQMALDRGFGIYDTTTISNDYGYDIKQTFDNGYIIVGYSDNHGFGAKDIFLTKLDQLGDTVWSKLYGTVQDEIGHTVVQTSDGGYAISGYTKDAGAGIEDMFLMKTDEHEQIDDICIIGVKI